MSRTVFATRNTCFAILSAVESDIRDAVSLACLESKKDTFLPSDVRERALARFSQDGGTDVPVAAVLDYDVLPYTDFGDLAKILYSTAEIVTATGFKVKDIAPKLESLAKARNRVCHSRPLDEEDLPRFLDLAKWLLQGVSGWEWTELKNIQSKLDADPGYVLRLQIPEFWRLDKGTVPNNLPLPDYDETSFLGRNAERKDLKKHLLGRHPVVTLVGEGGVGKTALALQCVYDLLDLESECPYEAVVWVSLKNKILTASGISNIQSAVVDVLGILQVSANQLGLSGQLGEVPGAIDELRDYLREIKVLLIIDNFETLVLNPLRDLFADIPEGSKVLITSRVGLGEIELRYALDPLDVKTASNLLRKYAGVFNLAIISESEQKKLERYVGFLFRSPLLIKWFVQSVAAGADPERSLSRTNQSFSVAIKFCFENLFDRLSETEREVLHILGAARKQLTFTELMFLIQEISKASPLQIESALSTLHSSSMIKRSFTDGRSADVSTRLNLTDIASEYLGKFAPPSGAIMTKVQAALKKLRETSEMSATQTEIFKYEITAIRASTQDERICAVYLNQALNQLRSQKYDEARVSLDRVFTNLPSYSEAYRIASLLAFTKGDLYGAAEELDRALEHAPRSPLIYYQYAQLALQKLDDAGLALEKIDLALEFDPNEETLRTLRALALVRLGRCSDGALIYESLMSSIDERPRKWRITTRDQASECYRRWAEQRVKMREFDLAKGHLSRALEILEGAIAHGDFDERMGRLYANVVEDALFLARSISDEAYATTVLRRYVDASKAVTMPGFKRFSLEFLIRAFGEDASMIETLRSAMGLTSAGRNESTGAISIDASAQSVRRRGKVKAPLNERFGFIVDRDSDWFFHLTDMLDSKEWAKLSSGCLVSFEAGRDAAGKPKAVKVRLQR